MFEFLSVFCALLFYKIDFSVDPKLGISAIAADEILLSPALLTISKEANKHEKSY